MPTNGSPKAGSGPCGGFGQWNQRSPRLNVRNGPFLEVTPKCLPSRMTRQASPLLLISAIDRMSPQNFLHGVRFTFAQYHRRALSRGLNIPEKIWQID